MKTFAKEYSEFKTVTCLERKHVLREDLAIDLAIVSVLQIKFMTGELLSQTLKLYRKIMIKGNSYDFQASGGTDFWTRIVADSGMCQYDAIGNLILDQYDEIKISWTPYGRNSPPTRKPMYLSSAP